MAAQPPIVDLDWSAADFSLPATDGKNYSLPGIAGPKGTLVAFICNHCPYVVAIADKLVRDANELQKMGVATVAICSNDAKTYPEDSFEKMIQFAASNNFPFPYLHDESQDIAHAYRAVCTPDFFGFNAELKLQYRGRLDASRATAGMPEAPRDLFNAMATIAETGIGPVGQIPSMGCSIKWKQTA